MENLQQKLDSIEKTVNQIYTDLSVFNERLQNHMDSPEIHTRPPCEYAKNTDKKFWAVIIIVIGSAIKMVYDAIK